MLLIETIQLKPTPELRKLCHEAKNLYNLGNYYVKQNLDIMEEYLSWHDTKWMLKNKEPFKKLPSQVAQNVLKYLHLAWKSYFSALRDWKIHPKKYRGRPRPPKYLKKDGEFVACFNHQHIPRKKSLGNGLMKRELHFPKKTKLSPVEVVTSFDELRQVRIAPKNDVYNLELIYNHIEPVDLGLSHDRMMGIDIGLDNLACAVTNVGLQPFVINGRPLKSINRYYNKRAGHLQSRLSNELTKKCEREYKGDIYKKNGRYTSAFIGYVERAVKERLQGTKRMKKTTRIRNNKVKDYMHKASRYIINYCVENGIGTIVIGKNPLWKTNINLGKRTNQNFVQIPFAALIEKIEYKAKLSGIRVELITEEYTSKCSFLDDEDIKFHNKYKGRRTKRGLFRASDGRLINADVNGAYNILKKAFPKAVSADGIQGAQLHPVRINLDTKSMLEARN